MVARSDILARYREFGRGHHGMVDPTRAPDGSWSGTNAMLYTTGLIGPRLGFVEGPAYPAGMDGVFGMEYLQNDPANATFNDGLWAVFYDTGTSPDGLFLYYSEGGTAAWTLAGTTGALGTVTDVTTLTAPATFTQGINNFFTYVNVNGSVWHFDIRTPTVDPVAVTLGGGFDVAAMVKYRDWLVAADIEDQTNRIFFTQLDTAGSDFTVWPAANYYDVGDSFPITALMTTTNGLLVGKATGWWLVSGVLGDTGYIRQISSGYGPATYATAKLRPDNSVAVLSPDGTPGFFNGYVTAWFPEHRLIEPTNMRVVTSASSRRSLFIGSARSPTDATVTDSIRMHVRNDDSGAWEHWKVDTGETVDSVAPTYLGASRLPDVGYFIGCEILDSGVSKTARLMYDSARPGIGSQSEVHANGSDSDILGQKDFFGDDPIEAEVWLPVHTDRDQRMARVDTVRVNVKRWAMELASGGVDNNVVRVKVRTFDSASGLVESDWQEMRWKEPDTADQPVATRYDFTFASPFGSSFQIGFQMTGVAVRDITVYGITKAGND